MLLFSGVLADTGTWTLKETIIAPNPRGGYSMAFSLDDGIVLLYGGENASINGETWAYNYSDNTWSFFDASPNPGSIVDGAMVYDLNASLFLLYGGQNSTNAQLNDTWAYNMTDNSWTYMNTGFVGGIHGRENLGMAFNQETNRTFVCGGGDEAAYFVEDSTLQYNYSDDNTWYYTVGGGDGSPGERKHGELVYDSTTGHLLYIMGYAALALQTPDSSVWNNTDNTWTRLFEIDTTEVIPVSDFGADYDSANEKTVVFGGVSAALMAPSYADAAQVFNWVDTSWEQLDFGIGGTIPTNRSQIEMVFDNVNGVFIMFGGYNNTYNNETWALEFNSAPTIDSLQINGSETLIGEDILLTINHTDLNNEELTEFVFVFHDYTTAGFTLNDTYSFNNNTQNTTFDYLSGNYTTGTLITFVVNITDGSTNATSNITRIIGEKPYPWFSLTPTPTHMSDIITMEDLTYHSAGSGNSTEWEWDWGDDFNTTNDTGTQNMTHQYSWQPGSFAVILNTSNYWGLTNATHQMVTISGIRIMAWQELSPTANVTFNITISNSTNEYTEDVSSGVFIWQNVSEGIPTGSVTIRISKTNYEDRIFYDTFNSNTYINLTAYLISSLDCDVQPFLVIDQNADALEGVEITINKTFLGTSTNIAALSTDGTGYASSCLDPNSLHKYKAEKTGYDTLDWTSLWPSTNTKVIELTQETGGGSFGGLNSSWYILSYPAGPQINNSRDQISIVMNEPRCSAVWWNINITNETGHPYSWQTLTNPCYAINTILINQTYGLAAGNLTAGDRFIISVFEYSNHTNGNNTKNFTMLVTGATSDASIQNALELLSTTFSQTTFSFLALVIAMVIGGAVSRLIGFGGIFVIVISTFFALLGAFGWDVYIIALLPALASYLGKRWT